jgi:hypothetical protein
MDPISSSYNRADGRVAVVIVYRRPIVWTDRIIKIACGEFTHCEMYVPSLGGTFLTTVDFGMEFRSDIKRLYSEAPHDYAWHLIVMSALEYERMCAWNIEQVAHHCKYNYTDLVWQVAPYMRSYVHDLTQTDASHPKKMFCSQAVVLALRAAFNGSDSSPHMREFVSSMNSRLTTPGGLVKAVSIYTGTNISNDTVPMSVSNIDVCTGAALEKQGRMNVYQRHYSQ